jgi:hypothetical protein
MHKQQYKSAQDLLENNSGTAIMDPIHNAPTTIIDSDFGSPGHKDDPNHNLFSYHSYSQDVRSQPGSFISLSFLRFSIQRIALQPPARPMERGNSG